MALDLDAIRREFPFTADWNYLNHATHGPFPRATASAIGELATAWQSPAALDHAENERTIENVKSMLAGMINGETDQFAFTGNLAESMSLAAAGIDWREGDNCVLPAYEFPSVVYPFLNQQRKGVSVRFVDRGAGGFTDVDEIRRAVDGRTRAIVISYVEFSDGFRNDLKSLAELCRQHDALLVVDATQALGPCPIDVNALGIDVLGAHSYKWLMASYGVGVTWLSSRALERIHPSYTGRLSVKQGFQDENFELNWRDGAARFQTGGLNWITFAGLEASLRFITSLDQNEVFEHTISLTDRVLEGAASKGYSIMSSLEKQHRSAIVAISTGDRQRDGDIVAELEKGRISVALRSRGIRISPYFYNTADEVERFLAALPALND